MLTSIKNLPFAIRKLIYWILPVVIGFCLFEILMLLIGIIHLCIFLFAAPLLQGNPFAPDLGELWFLIGVIKVPSLALIGSFMGGRYV